MYRLEDSNLQTPASLVVVPNARPIGTARLTTAYDTRSGSWTFTLLRPDVSCLRSKRRPGRFHQKKYPIASAPSSLRR